MERNSNHYGTTLSLSVPVPTRELFSHRCTGDVLALLVDNPHTSFGIRDVSRLIDATHPTISSAIDDLESAGLVETEHAGAKKHVRIDRTRLDKPDDPIMQIPQAEFHSPVRELVDRVTDEIDDVCGVVLFGSVARGEADRRSDVDCFVLVDGSQAMAQQTADEITAALNETRFDGDRYKFHVLVESVESARDYGDRLREIFATGLTIVESEELTTLKEEVFADGRQ